MLPEKEQIVNFNLKNKQYDRSLLKFN